MKIVCITHVDFETPGAIEPWAIKAGHAFQVCKPYAGESLPPLNGFDCLILMGGPQSPLKVDEFPYLADEMDLIRAAIDHKKYVLGFCLGAQLIGQALGASTERSPEKEVGVYLITLTQEGTQDPLLKGLPQSFPVVHWHNDMPGLLGDSSVLATSEGCPRQIVRFAPRVYGFQCHMEITLAGIQALIEAVPGDLAPSKFTQTPEDLLSQDYVTINEQMADILNRFMALTL